MPTCRENPLIYDDKKWQTLQRQRGRPALPLPQCERHTRLGQELETPRDFSLRWYRSGRAWVVPNDGLWLQLRASLKA